MFAHSAASFFLPWTVCRKHEEVINDQTISACWHQFWWLQNYLAEDGALRRYLNLALGPGTGRERRFTLDEAITIAIAVELTTLGLSVRVAAHSANYLTRLSAAGDKPPIHEEGWILVIGQGPRSKPVEIEAPGLTPLLLTKPPSLKALRQRIKEQIGDPGAVVTADVSRIAQGTAKRLEAVKPKKKGRPGGR